MKISKKEYGRLKEMCGDMDLISAQKHNGRKAILFGNYSYHRYSLFLDDNSLVFDSWDSWQIPGIIEDYLKNGSYWYVGIW